MVGIDTPRRRLGRLVRQRRLGRKLSTKRAAELAKVDRETWKAVEEGEREAEEYTLAKIEPVIYWRPGSAEEVLAGREPGEWPLPEQSEHRPPTLADVPKHIRRREPGEVVKWITGTDWHPDEKLVVIGELYESPPASEAQSATA